MYSLSGLSTLKILITSITQSSFISVASISSFPPLLRAADLAGRLCAALDIPPHISTALYPGITHSSLEELYSSLEERHSSLEERYSSLEELHSSLEECHSSSEERNSSPDERYSSFDQHCSSGGEDYSSSSS